MAVSTQRKTTKKTTKKTRKPAAKKPVQVPTPTFVGLVFDHSTSMAGHATGAMQLANNLFVTLTQQDKLSNTHVSVLGFSDEVHPPSQRDVRPEWLTPLTSWRANGNTALFDGVDEAIKVLESDQGKLISEISEKIKALPKRTLKAVRNKLEAELEAAKQASFLIISLTDGQENWSRRFGAFQGHGREPNWKDFAKLLQEKIATDRYTFTFQCPPQDVQTFLQKTGLPAGCVVGWTQAKEAEAQITRGSVNYFEQRRQGARSVKDVFVANTADLKKKDLRGYEDISDKVKIWNVDKDCAIQEFVESHNQVYLKGNGYYQLTKKEEVQGYKDVLIVERSVDQDTGKEVLGKVFKNARDLIGLPANTVKVAPGDLSNKFQLYIQSSSTNRRLVRGTKFIYLV